MTDFAPAELPLKIDRVQGSRPSAGEIRLALSGSWHGPGRDADEEPLLVVQVEGRRHRFPADREKRAEEPAPGRWRAIFSVPDWAQPRHEGQAAVWIGNAVVPVPPLHGSHHAPPALASAVPAPETEPQPQPQPQPTAHNPEVETESTENLPQPPGEVRGAEPAAPPRPTVDVGAPAIPVPEPDPPRSGPLADLLLKEKVAALNIELEHQTADAVRLQGALGDVRAELDARTATQSRLETTLGELGAELKRLMTAVADQRTELEEQRAQAKTEREELERRLNGLTEVAGQREAETGALREELAASHVAREAALSEVAGLQAELSRTGAELAVTRERVTSETGDLGQANRLLADAKALSEQLRRERGG